MVADLTEHERNIHVCRTGKKAWSEAITNVIAEEQLERRAANMIDLVRFAFDLHSVDGRGCARRKKLAGVPFFHHADQA
jgi:hypothetical protein